MKEKDIPTREKVMIPIRVSDDLYKKIRNKVNNKKDKMRGYSINKYVSELIENNVREEKIDERK